MGGLVRAIILAGLVTLGAMALPAVAAAAPTGGISGTISNAVTFEGVEGAEACAYKTAKEEQVKCSGPADSEGKYVIKELPEAAYKVKFVASGYVTQWYLDETNWSSADEVEVESSVVPNIHAALQEAGSGSIAGRVTSNGQGVGGIDACAYSDEGYGGSCAETNGNGEYTISYLSPAVYSVSFSPRYNACEEELEVKVRCTLNANVISQSVNSVRVKANQTETVNVGLQTGGQISGSVTNASITHPAIGKIYVEATRVNSKGEEEGGGNSYGWAWTNASGAYTISGLESGSYKVSFSGDICTEVTKESKKEEECVTTYVGAYYHEKAGFKKAETVSVTVGSNTTGINESLREAFPTTPASTAAPALTGTPVVGQTLSCSQGSWSHEPTYVSYQWLRNGTPIAGQTGSTYTVQAADPGKSIACVVWAGNGAGLASAMSNAVAIPVPLAVFVKANVKGTVASVTLRCPGPGACSGTLKLVVSMRHGKRVSKVTVGQAKFSIAAGKNMTLRVRLTGQGPKLLAKSGKRGLKVQIAGAGVKVRAATLKAAKAGKHKKKKK